MRALCLKSAEGLAKMMTVIVTVFEGAGLTVSENKTGTMLLRTLNQVLPTSPLVVEAAGQTYMQTMQFLYLGGLIDANDDIILEIKRRIRLAWACYDRFKRELCDMEGAPFMLKVPLLKTEVMETLLYGCVTWTLGLEHFVKLRTAHPKPLPTKGSLAFSADSAPTTACLMPRLSRRHNVRASRRLSANGASSLREPYIGRANERLTHRVMFATMAGGVNRGRGRPEKNWDWA